MTLSVAVVGASGRMGQLAVSLIDASADLRLHSKLGSQTPLDTMRGADVVLDLTLPSVSPGVVNYAVDLGQRVVVGTSGWSQQAIEELRRRIDFLDNGSAALIVPNFSIGAALAQSFAQVAARYFSSVEIVEQHHAEKADSPSGTAIRTAELIHAARASQTQPLIPGVEQPARGQVVAGVPIHSVRLQGALARQETIFGGTSEQLILHHTVTSPQAYQQGLYLALTKSSQLKSVSVGLAALLQL
jgi:4-hydroxy-tetrahydrodipicolinate reductase